MHFGLSIHPHSYISEIHNNDYDDGNYDAKYVQIVFHFIIIYER
jgi:hypothetical protein